MRNYNFEAVFLCKNVSLPSAEIYVFSLLMSLENIE